MRGSSMNSLITEEPTASTKGVPEESVDFLQKPLSVEKLLSKVREVPERWRHRTGSNNPLDFNRQV